MCFGGGSQPAPVQPAPAPAPAAPNPQPSIIGQERQNQNIASGGTINGPSTRIDRTANSPQAGPGIAGGTGLNI